MTAHCAQAIGQGAVLFSGKKPALREAAYRFARLTQWLIISVVLAFLAACQGARTHQSVPQTPPVDPDWWLGPLSEAHDRLIDAALKACPPQGQLSNIRCAEQKIVKSFAPQNSAGAHCPLGEPGLLLCVDLFTATERIYRAMGEDPQGSIDWDDPYGSLKSLEEQIEAHLMAKCPSENQDACVVQEIAAILPISAKDADGCVLTSDVGRSVHCVTGVIRIEGYKNALRNV